MKDATYSIYKHTSPSGKVYIGKTCRKDPKVRWANGKGYASNKYFTNAINKYGWENFTHEILAKNLTKEEAYWDEIFFIKMFDSFNPEHGYNLTQGGDGGRGTHLSDEHKRKLIEAIRAKCTGLHVGENSVRARGCVQYTHDGEFVKKWGSLSDAARYMGVHYSCILRSCSGKALQCKGYIWRYDGDENTVADAVTRLRTPYTYKMSEERKKKISESLKQYQKSKRRSNHDFF